VDYYGAQQQDPCPRCGSTADVRSVQDLVNMYSQMHDNAMPGRGPSRQGGSGPEPFYGPESGYGPGPGRSNVWREDSYQSAADSAEQEIANIVMGAAARFIGRAIKNRAQRVIEERVMPAAEAKYQQTRQEQMAIAQRYPELRACLRDQVVFLAGGTRSVPMSEVSSNITQVTLAQADAVVARLRQP